MNFMFEWQEQYLTRSLRSLVRYCSCHSNIKFISSHHRVISSISKSLSLMNTIFMSFTYLLLRYATLSILALPLPLCKVSWLRTFHSEPLINYILGRACFCHATGLNSQKETAWKGYSCSGVIQHKLFHCIKIAHRVRILEISSILKVSERVLTCFLQGIRSGTTDYI